MVKDTKVQELIINELTKSRYEQMKDSGTLNENELYMVTDEEYVSPEDLATVATSGDYNDLTNTPDLATVATSGDYNDLSNTPDLANVAISGDYNDLSNTPDLATVATSGDYNDLTNTLTAGTGISIDNGVINNTQTSAEWGNIEGDITEQTDLQNALGEKSKVSIVDWETDTTTDLETLIINKLSKQQYDQLPEKSDDELYMITSTEDDRIIVDDELDSTSENPVQNKVITTALSEKVDSSSLANVAISGDYNDLSNTPTIPVVDQTYDSTSTNAQSGVAVAEALETVTIDIDNDTITRNNSEELQSVGIINPRTNTSLKIWEGTEQQWRDYYPVTFYNYMNGSVPSYITGDSVTVDDVRGMMGLAYGAGKFITFSWDGPLNYSTDGHTWTQGANFEAGMDPKISFANDKFYVNNKYSTDGISWYEVNGVDFDSNAISEVVYDGEAYYIISGWDSNVLTSSDGINFFTHLSNLSDFYGSHLLYIGEKFIAYKYNNAYFSDDAVNWTPISLEIGFDTIAYGNGKFVVINGNNFAYSTDCINWNYGTLPTSASTKLVFGGGVFCTGNLYSTDGISWLQVVNPSSGFIAYGDNKFVVSPGGTGSVSTSYLDLNNSSTTSYFTEEYPATTSSIVYSAPEVVSSLTISSVSGDDITLSDGNTYSYLSSGNISTYRTVAQINPDWLCNIEGVGVKIGNTLIANNTTSAEWGNITGTLSEQTDLQNALSEKVDSSSLANVATTGDYTDLTNTPTLANVATTGEYNDLVNIPTFANVATTGDYTDLTNTPTLANVATTGDYNDLINVLTAGTLINIDSNNEISTSASKVSYKDWDGSSSTTTDISNLIINNLTQEEYDDLVENDQINDNELYMILNSNYVTQSELEEVLSGKQDTLTAGAGISINNNVISTNGNVIKIVDDTPLLPEDGVVYFIKESE